MGCLLFVHSSPPCCPVLGASCCLCHHGKAPPAHLAAMGGGYNSVPLLLGGQRVPHHGYMASMRFPGEGSNGGSPKPPPPLAEICGAFAPPYPSPKKCT